MKHYQSCAAHSNLSGDCDCLQRHSIEGLESHLTAANAERDRLKAENEKFREALEALVDDRTLGISNMAKEIAKSALEDK